MDVAALPSSLGSVWAPGDGHYSSPHDPPTSPHLPAPPSSIDTGKDQVYHLHHVIFLNPAAPTAVSTYGLQIQFAVIMQMECLTCPLRREPAGKKNVIGGLGPYKKIKNKYLYSVRLPTSCQQQCVACDWQNSNFAIAAAAEQAAKHHGMGFTKTVAKVNLVKQKKKAKSFLWKKKKSPSSQKTATKKHLC